MSKTFGKAALAVVAAALIAPAAPAADVKKGTYKGKTEWVMNGMKAPGRMALTVTDVDAGGAVKAMVRFTTGLAGEATLTGTAADGVFRFKGPFALGPAGIGVRTEMKGKGTVTGDKIAGRYVLVQYFDSGLVLETDGTFEVEFDDLD